MLSLPLFHSFFLSFTLVTPHSSQNKYLHFYLPNITPHTRSTDGDEAPCVLSVLLCPAVLSKGTEIGVWLGDDIQLRTGRRVGS